jgi:hypothetical protein
VAQAADRAAFDVHDDDQGYDDDDVENFSAAPIVVS